MEEQLEKFLVSYFKHLKEIRWQLQEMMQDVLFMLWKAEDEKGRHGEEVEQPGSADGGNGTTAGSAD